MQVFIQRFEGDVQGYKDNTYPSSVELFLVRFRSRQCVWDSWS